MLSKNCKLSHKTILVTGAAGFIGAALVSELMRTIPLVHIVGIDKLGDCCDAALKEHRLHEIDRLVEWNEASRWTFVNGSLTNMELLEHLFTEYKFDIVVNLAAQTGLAASDNRPDACIESNIVGFANILEACRRHPVEHLLYASSASIYDADADIPYSTDSATDHPVSLYAATKKSNELLAYAYSKLYNIPSTGLRFFTVYGPAGRPDMAYYSFTEKLLKDEKIRVFNYGNCKRDFVYVDDAVNGFIRIMQRAPEKTDGEDGLPIPPHRLYNIGGGHAESLNDFISILGEELIRAGVLPDNFDVEAHKEPVPMQPGDIAVTYADTTALEADIGYKPSTSLREGLARFAKWYKSYHSES